MLMISFQSTLQFKLLRRRALKKYGFLITEAIQKGEQINICYDHTCSGLIPENIFRHLPNFIRFLFTFFEFRFWMKVNKLTKHINVVKFKDLDAKNHLLLAFLINQQRACLVKELTYFIDAEQLSSI